MALTILGAVSGLRPPETTTSWTAIHATIWLAGVPGCWGSQCQPSRRRDAGAHKMVMFLWQDGKKAIVWPEELAPGTPRFPTPPGTQRQ
jgi:hypothetical protein